MPLAEGLAGAGAGATGLGAGAGEFKELLTVSRMKGVNCRMIWATKSASLFCGGAGRGVVWMTGLRVGAGVGAGWTRVMGLDLI